MGMREGGREEGEREGEGKGRAGGGRGEDGGGKGKGGVHACVCVSSSSCMIMGIMKTLKAKSSVCSRCATLSPAHPQANLNKVAVAVPEAQGTQTTMTASFRTYWGKPHIVVEAGEYMYLFIHMP